MSNPKHLLAKSYDRLKYSDRPPDYALLLQHSKDVAEACKALTRYAGKAATFCSGLNKDDFDIFQKALIVNGWLQDIGKSCSHFQEMVSGKPEITQLIRHETASGLLVWFIPEMRNWLEPLSEILTLSVWGAIGHHRKFDEQTEPKHTDKLVVYVSHSDFLQTLADMRADIESSFGIILREPPVFTRDLIITRTCKEPGDLSARECLNNLKDEFYDLEKLFVDEKKKRLLALIKSFGIAADVAASAIAAQGRQAKNYSLTKWIEENLSIGLSDRDISKLISSWAWLRSSAKKDDNNTSLPCDFTIRKFQSDVANSQSYLTLAQAGCGSGKSLAAYLWAQSWLKKYASNGQTNIRLFFCLPTTGTTTEHFKDYALESGLDATLMSLTHSRSSVDLKIIAETAVQEEAMDSTSGVAESAQAALNAEQDKLESLALWSTPLVVTTSDTILGLMSNSRRAIYSLPSIVHSVIVFDEIHALDDQIFGHLLVFLKNFPNLPVLLMTASLPEERKRAIHKVRPDLNVIPGPPEFEFLERYIIDYSMSADDMWQAIEEELSNNGKVLWVRNRVEWANETFFECCARFQPYFPNISINVYHSRFRYKDRSFRHRQVIDDFKTIEKPSILVTTQVAEMSLDLSASLLITDIAPVPALIQRMGRLNRRSTPENPLSPKPALIRQLVNTASNAFLPYTETDISIASSWICLLTHLAKPLNQRDLTEAFAKVTKVTEYDIAKAEERACFFSGLWRTRPGMTRSEGHTIRIILEADLETCNDFDKYGEPSKDWLRQHELSIQFRESALRWRKISSLRIAPSDHIAYDFNDETKEGTGARWLKN